MGVWISSLVLHQHQCLHLLCSSTPTPRLLVHHNQHPFLSPAAPLTRSAFLTFLDARPVGWGVGEIVLCLKCLNLNVGTNLHHYRMLCKLLAGPQMMNPNGPFCFILQSILSALSFTRHLLIGLSFNLLEPCLPVEGGLLNSTQDLS